MGHLSIIGTVKKNWDERRAFRRANKIAGCFYALYCGWLDHFTFADKYKECLKEIAADGKEVTKNTCAVSYLADFFKVSRGLGYSITANDRSSMPAFLADEAGLSDHYFWDDILDAKTDGYLD